MGLHKLKNRISYEFDKTLTKGIGTLIWWLAVTTFFFITIITILVWFLNLSSDNTFFDQLWFFLLRSIGDDYYVKTPWLYRVLYLLIIFSNLFIMSVLIGILTQVIQERVEKLRKGHSKIIEKEHTIILGWSSLIFTILNEFETSARDEGTRKTVVILGNKDKVFMEDEIKRNVKPLKKVNVICRSGEASVKSHLDIVSLQTAKAIIILSILEKNSDNEVIKILLAINGFINHKKKGINSKKEQNIKKEINSKKEQNSKNEKNKKDKQNKKLDRILSKIINQIIHEKKEINSKNEQNKSLDSILSKIITQIEHEKKEINSKNKQNKSLDSILYKISTLIEHEKKEINSKNKQNKSLDSILYKIITQIEHEKKEINSKNEQNKILNSILSKIINQIKHEKKEINSKNEQNKSLDSILYKIINQIEHEKKEINNKNEQNKSLDSTLYKIINQIEHEKSEQNKRLDSIFSKIITQIEHEKNKKICNIITNNKAKLVNIKEFTAKIIAQTARQSGLPNVYEELFDYKGMEIYFIENKLEDTPYNELLLMYNDISVIGYLDDNKKPHLNPDNKAVIKKDNKLIVIAESLKIANKKTSYNKLYSRVQKECNSQSLLSNKILILGWNSIGNSILKELSNYIKPEDRNLEVTIVPNKNSKTHPDINYDIPKLSITPDLKRDFYDYEYLKETIKDKSFNSIILLSDEELEIQESDVKNITILHFIRDIEKKIQIEQKNKQILFNIDIVCQLKDDKNQELITDFHKNDFVVSAKFASLYYSQISQNLDLFKVFEEILSEEGSEIYFKKATDYFHKKEKINYIDVVELVSMNNETAIGYYTDKSNSKLNLCKNDDIEVKETDKIILLEETNFEKTKKN